MPCLLWTVIHLDKRKHCPSLVLICPYPCGPHLLHSLTRLVLGTGAMLALSSWLKKCHLKNNIKHLPLIPHHLLDILETALLYTLTKQLHLFLITLLNNTALSKTQFPIPSQAQRHNINFNQCFTSYPSILVCNSSLGTLIPWQPSSGTNILKVLSVP